MRFEIYWASLIVGRKFTVFALFDFVFEGNFPSTSPRRAYIWRSDLTDVFFCVTKFVGLIHGGAYFRNFTVLLVGCCDVVMLWCGYYSVSLQFLVLRHSGIAPSTSLEGLLLRTLLTLGTGKEYRE